MLDPPKDDVDVGVRLDASEHEDKAVHTKEASDIAQLTQINPKLDGLIQDFNYFRLEVSEEMKKINRKFDVAFQYFERLERIDCTDDGGHANDDVDIEGAAQGIQEEIEKNEASRGEEEVGKEKKEASTGEEEAGRGEQEVARGEEELHEDKGAEDLKAEKQVVCIEMVENEHSILGGESTNSISIASFVNTNVLAKFVSKRAKRKGRACHTPYTDPIKKPKKTIKETDANANDDFDMAEFNQWMHDTNDTEVELDCCHGDRNWFGLLLTKDEWLVDTVKESVKSLFIPF